MNLYIETTGTTCHISGERGVLKQLHRPSAQSDAVGAFVRLDLREAMLYVELGERSGTRRQMAAVTGWREVGRDEFDQLTGIADVRRAMGWDIREADRIAATNHTDGDS